MSYQYPEIRTFKGLFLQANSFNVPDGAMEEANNFVIVKDDLVSKRRGFYEFLDNSGDTYNNLALYQNYLMTIFTDEIAYVTETGSSPNITGVRNNLTGDSFTLTSRTARTAQANKNLYWTTDQGTMKIEAFNGSVRTAGIPPATDLDLLLATGIGFLTPGNQVSYRVVFSRLDSNNNLLLSAPGDVANISNPYIESVSYTSTGAGPYTITVTSTGHGLISGMLIDVQNGTSANANGTSFVITVLTANTFSYSVTSDPTVGTLDFAVSFRAVKIRASIPSQIPDGQDYKLQLYRSSQLTTTPPPDYELVTELAISSGDIANGFKFYTDTFDDLLLGAELYTNPNSQEGELQANFRPPLAQDIELYKGYMFYANFSTRNVYAFQVVDPSEISDGDDLYIKVSGSERQYTARSGAGNQLLTAMSSVIAATTLTLEYTAHNFAVGDVVLVLVNAGTLGSGNYVVTAVTANTFDFTVTGGTTATSVDFEGSRDTAGNYIFNYNNTSISFSVQLRITATHLVKAINSDLSSEVYANYISPVDDVPGRLSLTTKEVSGDIEIRGVGLLAAFDPAIPSSSTTVGESDSFDHAVYISKFQEPEAVPLLQFIAIGSRNSAILRVTALRDSVIFEKEDGVFRLTGDNPGNFTVTALDNTVLAQNGNYVDIINNQVLMMSNQGVCAVTESAVQIVSRRIEDVIQPILTQPELATLGGAVAYESERLFIMSTLEPQGTTVTKSYCYNILNGSWSTWDVLFKQGIVGPNDKLYLISQDNKLIRERKDFTKLDYTDQNYSITIDSVSADNLTITLTSAAITPLVGWVFIKDDIINKLETVINNGSNSYTVTVGKSTTAIATDVLQLYKSINATLTLSPFHAGVVGRDKQFSQISLSVRNGAIASANVSFLSGKVYSSLDVNWIAQTNIDGGWGDLPWGQFPWGLEDGINLPLRTTQGPILRVYVPPNAQRTTFIQPKIINNVATESIDLQAISFSVRGYRERTTK